MQNCVANLALLFSFRSVASGASPNAMDVASSMDKFTLAVLLCRVLFLATKKFLWQCPLPD
jgi:hypothetical protein